jgi:hypothetical protein
MVLAMMEEDWVEPRTRPIEVRTGGKRATLCVSQGFRGFGRGPSKAAHCFLEDRQLVRSIVVWVHVARTCGCVAHGGAVETDGVVEGHDPSGTLQLRLYVSNVCAGGL